MSRIIGSPLRYIQGPNEIENIFNDIADWGKNFLFILDKPVAQKVQPKIITAFEKGNAKIKDKKDQHEIKFENFNGESSMAEIDRLAKIAAASAPNGLKVQQLSKLWSLPSVSSNWRMQYKVQYYAYMVPTEHVED